MKHKSVARFENAPAGTVVSDGNNLFFRAGVRRKTWMLIWRDQKRSQKVRLGEYPAIGIKEARNLAQECMARVRQGLPPIAATRAPTAAPRAAPKTPAVAPMTVGKVLHTYMVRHVTPNTKDPDQIQWVVDRLLTPLHAKLAAGLTRADVTGFIDEVSDTRGGPSAYRAGSVLRAAFRFAIRRGDIESDPTSLMSIPLGKPRERVLSDVEIASLWRTQVPIWSRLFRVLLLSGLRLREAAEAPAVEIEAGLWTVPAARMKGARAHVVPLAPTLTAELSDLEGVRWLFRSPKRFDQPVKGFTAGLVALRASAGTGDDWTWHDTRRTIASGLQRLGAPFEVIEAILAHRRSGVSAVYQRHEYVEERRIWLEQWADHCRGLGAAAGRVVAPAEQGELPRL